MCVILPVKMNIKVNYSFGNVLTSRGQVFFSHETNTFKGTVYRTLIGLELMWIIGHAVISTWTANSKMTFNPRLFFEVEISSIFYRIFSSGARCCNA
jgi:hypothetical protein